MIETLSRISKKSALTQSDLFESASKIEFDTLAEFETLLEASDIYATRRIFLYVTEEKSACGIRASFNKRSFDAH